MFHADLHVHSRFSRACSKDCDLGRLAWWAARKGITVVGTGDFTHPAWAAELAAELVPAEPGLLRLCPDLESALRRTLPPSCAQPVRFLLSAEISTIYKHEGVTRKVHHLVYAPSLAAAAAISTALSRAGNLASDGRPILGLDSRDLLDIVLNAHPGCFLVPAHIWTPWFAVLGSKSGFNGVAECYRDLAEHIFAVETGLSSDPAMNWMCSGLDSYRLVSNSDAHSPPMLGREATTFSTALDYFAMADALRTGRDLAGTLNFFPEGGRYHLDGHRKCGVRFGPEETRAHQGRCPRCGKPLTVGVLHRVSELADRPPGYRPPGAPAAASLVSLPEIVAEIRGCGRASKQVTAEVSRLVAALGPELRILCDAGTGEIGRAGGSLLAEAISRLRRGAVIKEPGYDGEYGVVRLFQPGELSRAAALFDVPAPRPAPADPQRLPGGEPCARPGCGVAGGLAAAVGAQRKDPAGAVLAGLDPDQRAAALAPSPLLIVAGPGTGKTATLTHRIAAQVAQAGLAPAHCLALTFTRRAAGEMRGRLAQLLGERAERVTVTTFHGLGMAILREHAASAGLPGLTTGFTVASEPERLAVAAGLAGSAARARRLLAGLPSDPGRRAEFTRALAGRNLVDFDALVELPAALAAGDPALAAALRGRWRSVSVDEYQDVDAAQYALLRALAGDGRGLTAIGDPDQAIYGFRGADVSFFLRFGKDFPGATTLTLTRNYRSARAIVTAAQQAVAPASLAPGRVLQAATSPPGAPARVTVHEAADPAAEASWIALMIDRLLGGASFHSLDSGRAEGHAGGWLSLADFAVLYRTDAQAGVLSQALARAGLPCQKRSHDLLLRRPGVAGLLAEIRRSAAGPPAAYSGALVTDLLAAACRGGRDAGLLAAAEVLAPLARRCGTDLGQFLAEIELGAEADALDPRADAVTLLTLHAAKGLEFAVVFLAGCERGLLPLWLPGQRGGPRPAGYPGPDGHPGPDSTLRPGADGTPHPARGPDPAEERRLLFVGMTRARSHLFLTCAARRPRPGGSTSGPSPFLWAIDPGLLDWSAARPRPPARQLRLL